MLISDIPYPKVREAAIKIVESIGILNQENLCIVTIDGLFQWGETPQGHDFWAAINYSNYTKAMKIDKEKGLGLFDEEPTQFHVGQKVVAVRDGFTDLGVKYKKGDVAIIDKLMQGSFEFGIRLNDIYRIVQKCDFKPYTSEEQTKRTCHRCGEPSKDQLCQSCDKIVNTEAAAYKAQKEDLNRNAGLIGPVEKAEQEIEQWREERFQVFGDPLKSDWKGWHA